MPIEYKIRHFSDDDPDIAGCDFCGSEVATAVFPLTARESNNGEEGTWQLCVFCANSADTNPPGYRYRDVTPKGIAQMFNTLLQEIDRRFVANRKSPLGGPRC